MNNDTLWLSTSSFCHEITGASKRLPPTGIAVTAPLGLIALGDSIRVSCASNSVGCVLRAAVLCELFWDSMLVNITLVRIIRAWTLFSVLSHGEMNMNEATRVSTYDSVAAVGAV